jgi:hypothetical protein
MMWTIDRSTAKNGRLPFRWTESRVKSYLATEVAQSCSISRIYGLTGSEAIKHPSIRKR